MASTRRYSNAALSVMILVAAGAAFVLVLCDSSVARAASGDVVSSYADGVWSMSAPDGGPVVGFVWAIHGKMGPYANGVELTRSAVSDGSELPIQISLIDYVADTYPFLQLVAESSSAEFENVLVPNPYYRAPEFALSDTSRRALASDIASALASALLTVNVSDTAPSWWVAPSAFPTAPVSIVGTVAVSSTPTMPSANLVNTESVPSTGPVSVIIEDVAAPWVLALGGLMAAGVGMFVAKGVKSP